MTEPIQSPFEESCSETEPLTEDGKELLTKLEGLLRFDSGEILRRLERMSERDREVLEFRLGVKDGRPHSFEEISREFGITREEVRKAESRLFGHRKKPSHQSTLY